MALQKKHRAIIDSALQNAYERLPLVPVGDVAPGSIVVVRFDEKGDPPAWQTLLVVHHNKADTKCSDLPSVYSHYGVVTDIKIGHAEWCAVLTAGSV